MTILQGIRDYFLSCPLMTENRINVDYLPEDANEGVEFSIDATPSTDVVTPYGDGGADCQYQFVFRSINAYGPDIWQSIANHGFYEALAKWMREQTRKHAFPEMPEGMVPKSIEPTTTAYLFGMGASTGRYQIQCRLSYYRKGGF